MKRSPGLVVLLAISSCLRSDAAAQIVDPVAYRGTIDALVHGRLDTTLVDLRFTNRGELAVHDLDKTGTWRRGIGGPHIDGMALIVGASVTGERAKWASLVPGWEGKPDTMLTPVTLHYGGFGERTGPSGEPWGWLPAPGFLNPDRLDPETGLVAPIVA